MAFCSKCGAELPIGSAFCTQCGAKVETSANDYCGVDRTTEFDSEDMKQNKVLSIFAYLGLLVLVPIFAAPKSQYARFHANQGLILLIGEVAWGIVTTVLKVALRIVLLGPLSPIYLSVCSLLELVDLVFLAFAIIGIVHVAQDQAKELPIIGKIRILK